MLILKRARHADEPGRFDLWSEESSVFVLECVDETEIRRRIRSDALISADAAVDLMLAELPPETH